MSSFVIALDINDNHITATLVRIEQSLNQCLSIERDLFHIRSFKNNIKKNPNLILSCWIDCIDDLMKDFVDNYKEDDHIIGIACSFNDPMDYEQNICCSQTIKSSTYEKCFGLNLRLLLQSGLRHLTSRWKNTYYSQCSTQSTVSHSNISFSKRRRRQSISEETTTILLPSTNDSYSHLSIVPSITSKLQNSKLSSRKLRDYCGLIEHDNFYNEEEQMSPHYEIPIHQIPTNSSKLWSTIEQFSEIPISFYNNTICFALGEANNIHNKNYERILVLTLGIHFGSIFLDRGKIVLSNELPSNCLHDQNLMASDHFSTSGLINIYEKLVQRKVNIVDSYSLALCASNGDENARKTFEIFAQDLGNFLIPYIKKCQLNLLIIGGDIAQAWYLLENELNRTFNNFYETEVYFNISNEKSICLGAVQQHLSLLSESKDQLYRQTDQYLLPVTKHKGVYEYDIYPCHEIPIGYIGIGHKQLNEKLFRLLKENHILLVEGFIGTNFDEFAYQLNKDYQERNQTTNLSSLNIYDTRIFLNISKNFKQELDINIDLNKLNYLQNNLSCPCVIIGPGASYINETSPLIYIDLPMNELYYRIDTQKSLFSSFKFNNELNYLHTFDYRIFNKLKQDLFSRLTYFVDGQRPNCPTWLDGETFRQALAHISNQPIRLRPLIQSNSSKNQSFKKISGNFSHFHKNNLKSFEIISSGNGIILSDINSHLVEFSSNIFYHSQAYRILGNDTHVRLFHQLNDFPIHMNIFDTMDGKDFQYINENFTENTKHNKILYIIETKQNSAPYISLNNQENINRKEFYSNPIKSSIQNILTDIHEFFLLFNKTIHLISRNQVILEICTTSNNTTLSSKSNQNDIQVRYQPVSIRKEENKYEEQHLLTNDLYIYDIQRLLIEPNESIQITQLTENRFHLCILVAGDAIEIEFNSIDNNSQKQIQQYNSIETFLIPATIHEYRLRPIIKNCKAQSFILLIIYLK